MTAETSMLFRSSDPVTSKQAAAANPLGRSVLRRRIASALAWTNRGGTSLRGYTDDELAIILDAQPNVIARRRRDLVDPRVLGLEHPAVMDLGITSRTRSGQRALVWLITDYGYRLADPWTGTRTPDELLRLGAANLPAGPHCPFSDCLKREFVNDAELSRHLRLTHGAHSTAAT